MTTNDAVAKRIIYLLSKNNMTQYSLEKKSGIQHGSMGGIMCSRNKTVTLNTIYKLARGFDMTYAEFLDDDLFRSEEIEFE